MTADEMFRELGYERFTDMSGYYFSSESSNITFFDEGKPSVRINGAGGFSFEEILACAQLIKEMEAEK